MYSRLALLAYAMKVKWVPLDLMELALITI